MERHDDLFVDRIQGHCRGKEVLEIGCGDGTRLASVARASKSWIGIDPDLDAIRQANDALQLPHAQFEEGNAETLKWPDSNFDVVVFTLSLHHIELAAMSKAIAEAIRVVRPDGAILFLEPLPEGTFYKAELRFGCCDGDERRRLAYAFYTMMSTERFTEIDEFVSEVWFDYDSFDDFKRYVPTIEEKDTQLEEFLAAHGFRLDEKWRLNVFKVTK